MIETLLQPVAELQAPVPLPDLAPLLEQVARLRQENTALRAENVVLQQRVRELEARLGQVSSNSSRPPSSDPPQAPAKRRPPPTGRKRGGQPGHRGTCHALWPAVLWRKGSFGSDSESGSQFAERLLTVVVICRQQGRRLLDFLVATGEAALQGTAAPSFLPAGQGHCTLTSSLPVGPGLVPRD